MCAVELDERLRGGVLGSQGLVVMECRRNLLGELLAKLDAPLIVGVNAPDRALNERDVLIERDELAECERGELVSEDRGRGTVAREAPRRHDLFRRALGAHLVGRLAESEGLGLRKEVAQEELMDILVAILGGMRRVGEGDEIGGIICVP